MKDPDLFKKNFRYICMGSEGRIFRCKKKGCGESLEEFLLFAHYQDHKNHKNHFEDPSAEQSKLEEKHIQNSDL